MALKSRQTSAAAVRVTPAGMDNLIPSDGEVIRLVVDQTSGIEWLLGYDAKTAGGFPWVFLGGSPMRAGIAPAGSYTPGGGANWMDLSAANGPGPDLIAPRDGVYDCYVEAGVAGSTAGNFHGVAVQQGAGATPADLDAAVNYTDRHVSVNRYLQGLTLNKADRLRMLYRSDDSSGTSTFTRRVLRLHPIRLG